MLVYIIMLIISITFAYLANKNKENKKKFILFGILSAMPFIIVSAIRYNVGTDYLGRYTSCYNYIINGSRVHDYELGFYLLNRFCLLFTTNPVILFAVTSILINGLVFWVIFKYSKNPIIAILVYFFGAFYFQSMNGIRQFLAMAILLIGYPLVLKKSWKNLLGIIILSILAISMHDISAMIAGFYILYYLIAHYAKKQICINWKATLGIVVVLLIAAPFINMLIHNVLAVTRFKSYIDGKFDYGDLQIIPFAVNIIIYAFICLAYKLKKEKETIDIIDKLMITLQALGVIALAMTNISFLFLRISYMFTFFQIISIALYWSIIKKYLSTKKVYVIYITLALAYIASFTYINVIHRVEEALPYQTVFNINEEQIKEKK